MSDAPHSLTISSEAYNGYTASWTKVVDYSLLHILYSENGGAETTVNLAGTDISYAVTATEGVNVSFRLYWEGGTPPGAGTTGSVSSKTILRPAVCSSASQVAPGEVAVYWSCAAGTETAFDVYYALASGGGWSLGRTEGADATDGTVTGLAAGHTYKFKVVARNAYTSSADSNEVTCYVGTHYVDNLSATSTSSASISETAVFTDSLSASSLSSAAESDTANYQDALSATATSSAATSDGLSIKTDFAYYWGTETGTVQRYDTAYLSDNGSSITSYWTSKDLDFVEQDVENTGRWKTIYRFEYLYRDLYVGTQTSIKMSNDGGNTWTTITKSVGADGDGRTEHDHFHTVFTGQFFVIRVEWASSDKNFQFLGFDIVYEDAGEQF